jgi:hypothetical protein
MYYPSGNISLNLHLSFVQLCVFFEELCGTALFFGLRGCYTKLHKEPTKLH